MGQLFAHEVWWRVVEVLHVSETDDGKLHLITGRIEYRKTHEAAERLVKKWSNDRSAIIQGGIITWYPDDELDAAFAATDWMKTQNYDDRDEE